MKQYEIHAVLLFHMSGILFAVFLAVSFFVVFLAVSFFGGISGGIFAVFLVFLQYRYGTETTVSHVSNTEYRYCIKIGYTAMHWFEHGHRNKSCSACLAVHSGIANFSAVPVFCI